MTRNLFDQYSHAENRLTHALLCALTFERKLLSTFLRQYVRGVKFERKLLKVSEQTFPEISEPTTDLEIRKSLPDGIIFESAVHGKNDEKRHALIIESKITTRLTNDQLRRHTDGVRSKGFLVSGLAIIADEITSRLPEGWSKQTWADIYAWLVKHPHKSIWITELIHFFEVLEAQMVSDNSLGDRALTRFNGIPFNSDRTYNYPEAKRLIRLLRAKMLKDRRTCKRLGIAPDVAGRKAITEGAAVWDYLSLQNHPKGKAFTYFPHLTFSIGPKSAVATITVPNAVRRDILGALRTASEADLKEAVSAFLKFLKRNSKEMKGARPTIILLQRRYKTQRSPALFDATLNFDLRTAFGSRDSRIDRTQPKYQPEWLRLMHEVIRGKHSNIQFQIGCEFDYEACAAIRSPNAEGLFVITWQAGREFFKTIGVKL